MQVPVLFEDKKNCCGCGACKAACKIGAIEMKYDEYGFDYPVIDEMKCVKCGKCKSICGFQAVFNKNSAKNVYAAVTSSTDIMESASGGVFACIASEFLKHNGEVIGAALEIKDSKINIHHIAIDDKNCLGKLLGSKYVQSSTSDIFEQIKCSLAKNKKVLFSGTPCQIAALYSYLGGDNKNLYTIDIICHGVPGRKMFCDYIDFLSQKYGKIKDFVFRDKKRGITFISRLTVENNGKEKIKYIHNGENSYFTAFLNSDTYRDCCYECKFASPNRIGDITIGDFWGIKEQHPELFDEHNNMFDPEKGISSLIINTEKGDELVNKYGVNLITYKSSFSAVSANNSQLICPSVPKDDRDTIMNIYKANGYQAFEQYFRKLAGLNYYLSKLKGKIPLSVKSVIKKALKKEGN